MPGENPWSWGYSSRGTIHARSEQLTLEGDEMNNVFGIGDTIECQVNNQSVTFVKNQEVIGKRRAKLMIAECSLLILNCRPCRYYID